MGLRDILDNAVHNIISPIVDDVKVTFIHHAWIGEKGNGEDIYASPTTFRAVADRTARIRETGDGGKVMVFATLTEVDGIASTTATFPWTRQNPVDPRDKIIFPDGSTAPITKAGGPQDPVTGVGFINEIEMGSVVRGQ